MKTVREGALTLHVVLLLAVCAIHTLTCAAKHALTHLSDLTDLSARDNIGISFVVDSGSILSPEECEAQTKMIINVVNSTYLNWANRPRIAITSYSAQSATNIVHFNNDQHYSHLIQLIQASTQCHIDNNNNNNNSEEQEEPKESNLLLGVAYAVELIAYEPPQIFKKSMYYMIIVTNSYHESSHKDLACLYSTYLEQKSVNVVLIDVDYNKYNTYNRSESMATAGLAACFSRTNSYSGTVFYVENVSQMTQLSDQIESYLDKNTLFPHEPTLFPTFVPSNVPSNLPSGVPSDGPTSLPSMSPFLLPTVSPTSLEGTLAVSIEVELALNLTLADSVELNDVLDAFLSLLKILMREELSRVFGVPVELVRVDLTLTSFTSTASMRSSTSDGSGSGSSSSTSGSGGYSKWTLFVDTDETVFRLSFDGASSVVGGMDANVTSVREIESAAFETDLERTLEASIAHGLNVTGVTVELDIDASARVFDAGTKEPSVMPTNEPSETNEMKEGENFASFFEKNWDWIVLVFLLCLVLFVIVLGVVCKMSKMCKHGAAHGADGDAQAPSSPLTNARMELIWQQSGSKVADSKFLRSPSGTLESVTYMSQSTEL